jgi:PAS domain S-box-containing protein
MPPLRSDPDIPLTQELDRLVAKHLASGRYRDAGEVLRAALHRLDDTPTDATAARVGPTTAERDAVLGQLTEGVIVTDPAGRITFVNEAAARLHGVAQLDVPPPAYSATYHLFTEDGQPYPPEELPLARAVLRGEIVVDARWRIRRPDGTEVLAIGSARPLHAPGGAPIGAVLTLRDDTARESAEQALRESEAKFRTLADNIPPLCWMADPDGWIFWYNRRWHEYTGTTPAEMAGWGWRSVHDPEVLPSVLERWRASIASGKPFEMVFPLKGADGSFRPFLTRVAPIRDGAGRVVRWFGTNTDITEQRASEERLRESEARFRTMADSAPALIWMTDAEANVTFANRWYEEVFARPPEEILGEGWRRIVHADDVDGFFAKFLEAFEARRRFEAEVRVWHKDGRLRWLRCEGAPRTSEGAFVGYVGCNVDITDRKAAEEQQRLLLQELSHRVKNTLAVVQGIAARSLTEGRGAAEARDVFTRRLRSLANAHGLLTASEWRGASLAALVEDELRPYGARAALAGADIAVGPRATLTLGLVLHELATNAVKHGALSAPDGRVEVAWHVDGPDDEPTLRLRWREAGGPAVVAPARRGFGRNLVEQAVAHELGGDARLEFPPEGAAYELRVPVARLTAAL